MSLFGGDSSAPPTESENESEFDNALSSVRHSPPASDLRSPQTTRTAINARDAYGPGPEDFTQDLAGNDADSEESDDDHHPERSNRFRGPPQTWKSYTAADRQIVESLQQLEDSDLAAHLYDAHALKRRVRKPATELSLLKSWQNKDDWLRQKNDLQYTDAAGQVQTELIPSKDWTAWPVPPTSLYTLNNRFRRVVVTPEDKEWVIGGSEARDPGEELNDEMLGVFLRLAKDNWNQKDWEDEHQQAARKRSQSRARSRSQSAHSDVEMKNDNEDESGHDAERVPPDGGARRGRKPQIEADTRPAILADDAKARRLLQPTITSILSELDDVALALHRTRLNHFGRGVLGEGSSQSEFTTDAETTGRESRSRSRSRTKSALRSRPATRQSSQHMSSRASLAPKSVKKDLKPPVELEDSDSASDYGAQFDNKDPHYSAASRSLGLCRKRSRSESTMDEDDVSNTRDWSRANLMDWSEILGIASVKGWNQEALARTAQRCSTLFGESMSFMPFHEDLATRSRANIVQYTPSTIPGPRESFIGTDRPAKRPYFQPGAIRCPHTDCRGHHKDFAMSYRVIEHCMRAHGYDPRSNDSDNEDRTHGGVHIDGFLKPITAKQGWLGHGRSKAGGKKRKTKKAKSETLAGVANTIDEES